jgi:hypothetical protein
MTDVSDVSDVSNSLEETDEHVMVIGDFIKITSQDPELNSVWKIEYISPEKIVLLKIVDGEEKTMSYIIEDGVIQDDRIENIELLVKDGAYNAAYSVQRELFPEKWVEIVFQGLDEPIIGKIVLQANDSIDVSIYENGELAEEAFTLDFNYAGLPEGVISINIIKDPTTYDTPVEEEPLFKEKEEDEYIVGEDLAIQILEERDQYKFRYGIGEQTNDLLESLLSKVPLDKQTDERILAKINKMILRFKQLRELFSEFDENKNIRYHYDKKEAINWHGEDWKPLKKAINKIGWILPVAKNVKKIYDVENGEEYDDVTNVKVLDDLTHLKEQSIMYEDGASSYSTFYNNIASNFVPFTGPNDVTNTFSHKMEKDTDVLIGNFDNMSNTFNKKMVQTPFQINRYNSAVQYIQQHQLSKSTYSNTFHTLMAEDDINIRGLVTLPTECFKYSRVKLAGTDMITRVNLGVTVLMFSRLLDRSSQITSLKIDNIHAPTDLGKDFSGKFIKEYSYIGNEDVSYDDFLDYFIPTTGNIIENNKNRFSFKHLTMSSIMTELEPYSLYTQDLTMSHYNLINSIIRSNAKHYSKKMNTNKNSFEDFKRKLSVLNKYRGTTLIPMTDEIKNIQKTYIGTKYFEINPNPLVVSSEILSQMMRVDEGRLFHSFCADSSIELLTKMDESEIEKDSMDLDSSENVSSDNKCSAYIISNRYNTLAEMEMDNQIEIYFDEDAGKQVVDGHYAVVKENSGIYKRVNNVWELDETAPKNAFDSTALCNAQPDCIEDKNKCSTLDQKKASIEDTILSDRENMDQKIMESMVAYKETLSNEIMQEITNIQFAVPSLERRLNKTKYILGLELQQSEIKVSPYAKYVDMIVSHPIFDERQTLFIKFCSNRDICYESEEDSHWLYCAKTDTKLIPSFFYELAVAYKRGRYEEQMAIVLNERKAVDDNGAVWIDKYSGYTIKEIDFDTDEGYNESGFKNVTRGVIEDVSDENIQILMEEEIELKVPLKKRIDYDAEGRYIYGVIDTLSNHMKINIKNTFGFIIQTVTQIFNKPDLIMPKKIYMEQKTTKPYEEYLRTQLTYITLAVFIIVCQTRIPTIVPKGTFPGCVKSFSGYPVGNSDDKTSIIYLYCILNKTKFISISSKAEALNKYIDLAMQDFGIKSIVYRKRNSIEAPPPINNEHSIFKWTAFMPALVSFKLANIINVHEDFNSRLIEDIQTGNYSQHEKINVLRSKVILFSYAIQREIQKIVENENLILQTNENKALNENACCNLETINISTLTYFKNKTDLIEIYDNAVMQHSNALQSVGIITKSSMWSSISEIPKQIIQTGTGFLEKTVYAGIIRHCQFRTKLPISEDLLDICGKKPQNVKVTDSVDDIIMKLKQDNIEYTNEQLIKVLTLASKVVEYSDLEDNNIHVLDEILSFLEELNVAEDIENQSITDGFKEHMANAFEQKENSINELKRYVTNVNHHITENMKESIKTKTKKPLQFFLDGPRTQANFQFLKNSIINMGCVFPQMCISGKSQFKEKLPKYWGVSDSHNSILTKMYERILSSVILHSGMHTGFFKHIVESTANIVEMISKIPFIENEVGFLVLEHCLLLVFNAYMTTGQNRINDATDLYENEEDLPSFVRHNARTINKIQANVLNDFMAALIENNTAINVSYEMVEDKVFRLKEKEKNKLLAKLNDTKDLAIDNHFKTLRIGERWGMGENVRGYDKDRFDKERQQFVLDGEEMERAEEMNMDDAEIADYDAVDYQNEFDDDGDGEQ